jgi:probable rRNA maturation factor
MPGSFQLSISAGRFAANAQSLHRLLLSARGLVNAPLRQLSIVLIGDRMMAELHDRFMGLPDPTDVLTFPIDLDARGRPLSGEVFICVPHARRTAKSRGIDVQNEVLLYALHGMLHLCGFDDRTERGFARMHRKEDRILQQLGVGAVFWGAVILPASSSPRRKRNRVGRKLKGNR